MCTINHSFIEKLKNIDNNKGLDENLEIFTKLIYEDYIKIFKNDQKIIFLFNNSYLIYNIYLLFQYILLIISF